MLAGHAGAVRLDDYEASRRPVAAGVVAMTDRLTRAATARNPVARTIRNTALGVAGRIPPSGTSWRWTSPNWPPTPPGAPPLPGAEPPGADAR